MQCCTRSTRSRIADSGGDGIGDLRGVIERLDYVASLGVNTVWFNPCFASPFVDAGYDVSDYLQIAPRYGTNDDMVELVAEAKRRGIRVSLILSPGTPRSSTLGSSANCTLTAPTRRRPLHVGAQPPPSGWSVDIPVRPRGCAHPGLAPAGI